MAATWFCDITETPADGSKASCDRPVASLLTPSASVTVVRKAFAAPVALERSSSREPLASVMISAVTPAPEALTLSRTSASVSVALTVMSTAVAVGLAVKLVWPAPQVPSSMCRLPAPASAVDEAATPVASVCTLASDCTSTE